MLKQWGIPEDGETRIEVKFTGETVWLSQQQMAELYQTSRPNIVQHKKIYMLMENWTKWKPVGIFNSLVVWKFRTTCSD